MGRAKFAQAVSILTDSRASALVLALVFQPVCVSAADQAQRKHIYPYAASNTTLRVVNVSEEPAQARLTLVGEPAFDLRELAPGESVTIQTEAAGGAILRANVPVAATLRTSIRDVEVPAATPKNSFSIPWDGSTDSVAIVNTGGEWVRLNARITDEAGSIATVAPLRVIGPMAQSTLRMRDLFPDTWRTRGTIEVLTSGLVAAVRLREDAEGIAEAMPVAPGYWPTFGWRDSTPEQEGVDGDLLLRADQEIRRTCPECYSLVVIRNGHKIFERYYNAITPDRMTVLASVTKSVMSAIIGIAIAQGHLSGVEQRIETHFPEYYETLTDPRKRDIRIRHLLTMTAGFQWEEDWRNRNSISMQWSYSADRLRFALDLPLATAPGATFVYNTSLPYLLSAILTRTTNLTALEFARRNLFAPLGISRVEWPADRVGYNLGGSEIRLTPRDLAKFGYLYLKGGYWENGSIVRPEWVRDSLRQRWSRPGPYGGYGYLWWVTGVDGFYRYPVAAASGLGGQYAFVAPDLDLVAVTTANCCPGTPNGPEQTRRIFGEYVIPAAEAGRAPLISDVAPSRIRSGESVTLTITGQDLLEGTIAAPDECGLTVADVRHTATSVTAAVTAADDAPPRACELRVATPRGTSAASLAIAAVFSADGIVNVASRQPGLAPGALTAALVFSKDAPKAEAPAPWPTSFDGFEIRVGGMPAPIRSVNRDEIQFLAPGELARSESTTVEIVRDGVVVHRAETPVFQAAPGVLESDGFGVVDDHDGRRILPSNPIRAGGTYTLSATGLGADPVTLTLTAADVEITSIEASVSVPGIYRITFAVRDTEPGDVVRIVSGRVASPNGREATFRTAIR